MTSERTFDIHKLFEGSLHRLKVEAEYFSRQTAHNLELGRLNEAHVAKLLRSYLPPKFGIGTGFIACAGDKPNQSPQCDIIFYDAVNNSPLYASEAWSIFPIEAVYGVMEIKTTLDKSELEDSFAKCAKVRQMAKRNGGNKFYLVPALSQDEKTVDFIEYKSDLPPRFFIFGYQGWQNAASLADNFRLLSKSYPDAHIHGVCVLDEKENGSWYINHEAEKEGDARFSKIKTNGFYYLLILLPRILSSMTLLPESVTTAIKFNHRARLGFDLANLNRYFRSLTEEAAVPPLPKD